MDKNSLIKHLAEIDKMNTKNLQSSLCDRKVKEAEFHDLKRGVHEQQMSQDDFDKYYANKKYYKTVSVSQNYIKKWQKDHVKGKVFLDYACGNGANAIRAAKEGAKLAIGIDISDLSIKNARENAKKEGVEDKTFFLRADAEDTKLPEGCIDVVIPAGVLHHLDISYAFPELRRILAPGGKILAVEALAYNPFIKMYRFMTPKLRTEWEKHHILDLKDVKFASRFFEVGEVRFWHVTSYLGALIPPLLPLLQGLDSILTKIPYINRMAWIFTFELFAKEEG